MTPGLRLLLGFVAGLSLAGLVAPPGRGAEVPSAQPGPSLPDPGLSPDAELFTNGVVHRLAISLTPGNLDRLRQDGRQDVPALVVEDGRECYESVSLHLKGSTGSYRGIDDKPSLTLKFGEPARGRRFHGLRKLHLNNSVEDPGYFNEFAGSALFRAAGIPAPRVTHAMVTLNGRRLGLYVLKEGFSAEFLSRYFRDPAGNLYDTGPGHDVDEALEKDAGAGPDDRSDLAALALAAREPDLGRRWEELGRVLDRDRFMAFMAMEVLVGHRDGYCLARNNFRIYHDLDSGRTIFLPHGMDQLFGRPDATLRPAMQGLIARACLETPEGRRDYSARLADLATRVFDVPWLQQQADAFVRRVQGCLEPGEFRDLKRAVAATRERMALRRRSLEQQLAEPEPQLFQFTGGRTPLTQWLATDPPSGGRIDRAAAPEGQDALHISAGPHTAASWRTVVRLAPGRYRFSGTVATRGVAGLAFGRNRGAGLRVVGGSTAPPYQLLGEHAAAALDRCFELETEGEVELICELRARAGEAWFLLDSLTLEPLP